MQSAKRGRPKLTELERLFRRREHSRKTSKCKVHIGIAIGRWNELRDLQGFEGNTQFALYLLDLAEREFKKKEDLKSRNVVASAVSGSTPTLVGRIKAGTLAPNNFASDDETTCTGSEGEIDVMGFSDDDDVGSSIPQGRMIKVEKETIDEYQISPSTTSHEADTTEQQASQGNRVPENLQMDCETVNEDNLHEDTEMNKAGYLPTQVAPGNHGLISSDHALSIHDLSVNQPFSYKYPSPTMESMTESKRNVKVEQHFVPNATPIRIVVKGRVHQLSVGAINLNVPRFGKEKEVSDSVDTCHLKQSLESFEPYSDSSRGMHSIGTEVFDNVTIKTEWDEDEKYGIISDIMKDLIEKVVREGNISRNHEHSNSKRKTIYQKKCKITKKQRLLKYEDNIGGEPPHSSRSRSRGYRINYANLDKSGGLSDVSDLDDILSASDESYDEDRGTTDFKIPGNTECEVTDNSIQIKSKVGKKKKEEEDPDFELDTFFKTETEKKGLNIPELDTENSPSDSFINSSSDECSTADKKILDKEKLVIKKLHNKLKKEVKRMKVFLKDHPDKYYTEDQVSAERKFRGLKEAEKTFKLLVCAICKQFRTSNTVLLETHLEHHLNGDWNCKNCNFEGITLREYRKHMRENHPSGRRCFVCKKKCGWKEQMQEHFITVHNLLPYVCTRCSTKRNYVMFKEKSEYYQHYLENHKNVMRQCTFCGLYFLSSEACRLHACTGKESEMATCYICGKEMRRESVRIHLKRVHDNVRAFPCKLCSYAAKTAKELRFHTTAKHEGVHQVKCDICDFTCVRKSQLDSHMRTHTGHKPYKCDLCPYAAAWNVQLKEHKQLHGSPLGTECELCGIVVKKGASYSNHYKKHNGDTS